MKKQWFKIFLVVVVCVISSFLFGQTNLSAQQIAAETSKPFVKLVHSTGPIVQTIHSARGGFVSISRMVSQNSVRTFLIRKSRITGETIWARTLDFPRSDFVSLEGITQTTDGAYIIVGYSSTYDNFYYTSSTTTAIVVKLNLNGTLQWSKSYSLGTGRSVQFTSVVQMADDGFTASGGAPSTFTEGRALLLVRFTSAGDILWTKVFEKLTDDFRILPNDSGFILAAGISNGAQIIKLDNSMNILWARSFESPGFVFQVAKAAAYREFVIAGSCKSCNQVSLFRLKNDGEIIWKAKYSLQTRSVHSISDLIENYDNGFTLTGTLIGDDTPGNTKAFLLRIDGSRSVVFQETFKPGSVDGGTLFDNGGGSGPYKLVRTSVSRPSKQDTLVSKLNQQGIVPGCTSFYSVPTTSIPFGELKARQFRVKDPVSVAFGINSFAVDLATSHHAMSTICE